MGKEPKNFHAEFFKELQTYATEMPRTPFQDNFEVEARFREVCNNLASLLAPLYMVTGACRHHSFVLITGMKRNHNET